MSAHAATAKKLIAASKHWREPAVLGTAPDAGTVHAQMKARVVVRQLTDQHEEVELRSQPRPWPGEVGLPASGGRTFAMLLRCVVHLGLS